MKKTEKLIAALLTIALCVLFLVLKGGVINVAMTVLGVALIVLGVLDFAAKNVPLGVIKAIVGVLVIVFGWFLEIAVLYIVGGLLLVVGVLGIFELCKHKVGFKGVDALLQYVKPLICILIGVLLFLSGFDWVFIIVGVVTVVEGGILLIDAIRND
jgi:hypothetical protein